MSNAHLNVSTSAARHYQPTVNQDAQTIADGVTGQIKQAVHQALLDAASIADAKTRRSLQGQFPDEVLDALAGPALAALKQPGKQPADVTANASAHSLQANIDDLPKD